MTSRSSRPLSLAIAAVLGASAMAFAPSGATAAPLPAGYAAVELLTFKTSDPAVDRTFLNRGDDGTNSTIRLEAGAPGTVASMRFEYDTITPGFPDPTVVTTVIDTVSRNDDGAFAVEWAGPPTGLPGLTYNVRAVGLTGGGAVASADVKEGVTFTANPGVNLTNGTNLGYFKVPYTGALKDHALISVNGTRGPVETSNGSAVARETSVGAFAADGTRSSTVAPVAFSDTAAGAFVRMLDLGTGPGSGAAGTVDQVALWADLKRASGLRDTDTESFTLYKQAITTVVATPDRTNVSPGESAAVTVTVTDQDGKPVVGAQVFRQTAATPTPAPESVGTTDATGQVQTSQAGLTTAYYYANADDLPAFSSTANDKKSADVTITNDQAVPTSLSAASADGAAFDLGEVDNAPSTGTGGDGDATDVTVQVKDQKGKPFAPANTQQLQYFWEVTPFGSATKTRYPAAGTTSATHEGNGLYDITVPAGGDGTYVLTAGLSADSISTTGAITPSQLLTVKAGQAAIAWVKPSPEKATAGATSVVNGSLSLADGTGLPGRSVGLTFKYPSTVPSGADEDPTHDAGFTNGTTSPISTATVTTNGSGVFSVSVTDPKETPQNKETGDTIDAASVANTFGDAGATATGHGVDFVLDPTPTKVVLTDARESSVLRPGEFTTYTVTVQNSGGSALAGQKVVVSTDKGYFSKDDGSAMTTSPTPSPAPANGADAGSYQNDGKSLELTTGSDGTATVFLAMGRDTGFDDDGLVTSRVTASTAALSAVDDHAWSSANPLNGGTVVVVPSNRTQDSGNLPKAQLSDKVYVDVELTDQFGNLVGGENVTVGDDSATGAIAETDGTANDGTIVSDFARDGDATLTSTTAAPQKLTASWTTERTSYTGASTTTTTGTETLTGSYTVEWYAVDYAASNITFTPDGSGTRDVGSSVTLTYKALDQLGQPISDLYIAFARSGPGTVSDTSGAANTLTGADGVATYTFTGNAGGRADVSATARQGSATGEVVSAASRSASVSFAADKVRPDITVTKRIVGNRVVLRVSVTATSQDPVVGDVEITDDDGFVVTKSLNDNGRRKFVFRGVPRGFHSYDVTFVGNDQVKSRTRTITFNVR